MAFDVASHLQHALASNVALQERAVDRHWRRIHRKGTRLEDFQRAAHSSNAMARYSAMLPKFDPKMSIAFREECEQ